PPPARRRENDDANIRFCAALPQYLLLFSPSESPSVSSRRLPAIRSLSTEEAHFEAAFRSHQKIGGAVLRSRRLRRRRIELHKRGGPRGQLDGTPAAHAFQGNVQ